MVHLKGLPLFFADPRDITISVGDFYDFFRLEDGRIAFLVADVTGKGVPAALFMMNAKTTIKALMRLGLPLDKVATRANAELREGNGRHMLVSAWIGVLDLTTGEVEFVNAGHNPPISCGLMTALQVALQAADDVPYSRRFHTERP